MRRHRRRIGGRQPRHRLQKRKGGKGDDKGQDDPHPQRRDQPRVQSVVGDRHAALEPDGEQKVDRHALCRRLGDRQFAASQRGGKAQRKAQDHRRQ